MPLNAAAEAGRPEVEAFFTPTCWRSSCTRSSSWSMACISACAPLQAARGTRRGPPGCSCLPRHGAVQRMLVRHRGRPLRKRLHGPPVIAGAHRVSAPCPTRTADQRLRDSAATLGEAAAGADCRPEPGSVLSIPAAARHRAESQRRSGGAPSHCPRHERSLGPCLPIPAGGPVYFPMRRRRLPRPALRRKRWKLSHCSARLERCALRTT